MRSQAIIDEITIVDPDKTISNITVISHDVGKLIVLNVDLNKKYAEVWASSGESIWLDTAIISSCFADAVIVANTAGYTCVITIIERQLFHKGIREVYDDKSNNETSG